MRIGEFELDVVSGGPFMLDGGGMFGIIPKPLWERDHPADARNRIELDTNCAVIRGRGEVIVVDTGNGTKLGAKEQGIFAIDPQITLLGSLAKLGITPEDVTRVVFTHLHMDHAGGGTMHRGDGALVPTFPRARYHVQRREWEDALANRSHMRISYRHENLVPLQESDRLALLDGDSELFPGVRTVVSGGHTPGHQVVFLESQGETAICFGDTAPTLSHLRPPYLTAFDLNPYDTLRFKMPMIERAEREGWAVVWCHDPRLPLGRIVAHGEGRYAGEPLPPS